MNISSPQNVVLIPYDTRIRLKWDKVNGAEGYKILLYKDSECKKIFKTRYAENCTKTLLGFENGCEIFGRVCGFTVENGVEKCGEFSAPVSCIPFSAVLKLNRKVVVLKRGDSYSLKWELNNTKPEVTFESSDEKTAKVDQNGKVTALSRGRAVITARLKGSEQMAETVVLVERQPDYDIISCHKPLFTKTNGCYSLNRKTATITLCGDLMCTIDSQRKSYANGCFDFKPCFSQVKGLFSESNLNIGVLETCISSSHPYEMEERRNESGVPNCNSPASFLSALRYAGLNGVVTANNHCCDTGRDGLLETIEQIENHGLVNIGSFSSLTDKHFSLFEVNGIKIAVLAYFQVHNGVGADFAKSPFMLNRYSQNAVQHDVLAARKDGAEFVICYNHWGVMNSTQVTPLQKQTALEMAEAGVDFIAGSHPHVVQKFEYVTRADGKKVPCIYSMGNFFTEMSELKGNRDSVAVRLRIGVSENGKADMKIRLIPCRTVNSGSRAMIIPCEKNVPEFKQELSDSKKQTEKLLGLNESRNTTDEKIFLSFNSITAEQVIKVIGGKANFDTSLVKDRIITKFTYSSYSIKNSVYFTLPYRDDVNPYNVDIEVLKSRPVFTVTEKEIAGANCIIVPDVREAYQKCAGAYRQLCKAKIVSVTGSVGKTTTKNIITSVLEQQFKTQCTNESKNIPTAVADHLLRIDNDTEYFVLETASSQPNQIHKSSMIAHASACVITNIGTSHIDLMGSMQNICDTKMQILDGAVEDAPIFLSADDPFLSKVQTDHPVIYYGIDNPNCNYRAENVTAGDEGYTFDVVRNGKRTTVEINLHGQHNVYNALAAFAIGEWAGVSEDNIKKGLSSYKSDGLRQNVFDADGITVIADCYSADTVSMVSAVKALHQKECSGKRICVLGHIMRMGKFSKELHYKVAEEISKENIDLVLCYDDDSHFIADRINELGGKALFFNNNKYRLVEYLRNNLQKGDMILFKGAQKYSHFEDIIGILFKKNEPPVINAYSAIGMDISSGEVKFSQNSRVKRPPISLTMLLTAIVAIETTELDKIVTVSENAARYSGSGYANMKLKAGDKIPVKDLLYGMVIGSFFDAACVLAECAGGSEEEFVKLMNKKAREIGAVNSNFTDPCGVDTINQHSTAEDLMKICAYGMKIPAFAKIAATKEYITADGTRITNKNRLLNEKSPFYYPFATGLKTSNNKAGGYCLAASGEKNGKQGIVILLGSPDKPRGKNYDQNTPNLMYSYTDGMKGLEFLLNQ